MYSIKNLSSNFFWDYYMTEVKRQKYRFPWKFSPLATWFEDRIPMSSLTNEGPEGWH